MKVLMISTDEKIFQNGSEVRDRMKDYGDLVDLLHIVVLTKNNTQKSVKISDKVYAEPLDSAARNIENYAYNLLWKYKNIFKGKEVSFDLVTAQDPFETGRLGLKLKKTLGAKFQAQVHTDFLSRYFAKESTKNRIRVIFGKLLLKKADGIRVVSERVKKSLVMGHESLGDRITVLPIFVDVLKIKNSPVKTDLKQKYPGRFIVLMASRLTKEKNIGLAIDAMAELVKKHPKVLLLIVGSGPECEALKSQITNHKLQNNVVIEDWTDDLPSYYNTADLFLLTSNYEGYGRTVVEATAAGLPVLMTDVGVAVGSVISVGDKKELTRKLSLLIEDPLERDRVLKSQEGVLDIYCSKADYLDRIKRSWSRCLTSRIHDSDMTSESGQNT